MRRVLIVSPNFPPINAPDHQRVRLSLPYYRDHGWEPIVLAIDETCNPAARESDLLATIPPGIEIHRCGAIPAKLGGLVGVGNLGLRAWLHLCLAGARLLRKRRFDLVFFSSTQFVVFPLGRLWRFLYGVPYVFDLQDPWRTDYYERPGSRRPPGGWKYRFASLQARVLEPWSFRRLSGLMSVSDRYLADLRERYRWFGSIPTATIGFGASEADLDHARRLPPSRHRAAWGAGVVRFVYTGAAGPIMPHALRMLFAGVRSYARQDPAGGARLRFEFYGTSYAAPGTGRGTIKPLAEEYGLGEQVHEVAERLGHLESIQLQANADVVLLLGSSDLAYSPSKLYPYYLSGRPMMSVIFRDSVLEETLRVLSCSRVVAFTEHGAKDEACRQIGLVLRDALDGFPPGTLPVRNDAYFRENYLARFLTKRQCGLFDQALAAERPRD